MEILLGIFCTAFHEFRSKHAFLSYGDFCTSVDRSQPEKITGYSLRHIEPSKYGFTIGTDATMFYVDKACEMATQIQFRLDGIRLPLNPMVSITCEELKLIINDKTYLNKTIFWLNDKIVETNKVLTIIDMCENNQLTFKEINLIH